MCLTLIDEDVSTGFWRSNMQDRVKEILESLRAEWELAELYSWQIGLDLMIQGRKEGKPYTLEIIIGDWHGTDVAEYLRQERGSWVSPTYTEVMDQALLLSDEDLTRLRRELDEYIKTTALLQHIEGKPAKEGTEPLLDVREFRGIGHGTWTDVGGVDEFIKQERASWDS
jgi:hypothetical protein